MYRNGFRGRGRGRGIGYSNGHTNGHGNTHGNGRGKFNGRGGRGRGFANPPLINEKNWRQYPAFRVRVKNLPGGFDTSDVYNVLKEFGNIARIDVFEDFDNPGIRQATVLFEPPPEKPIWDLNPHQIFFEAPDQGRLTRNIIVDKLGYNPPEKKALSDNREYPPFMHVRAERLEFGFMYQPNQMMSMYTVRDGLAHPVMFRINLHRKELGIYFSVRLTELRNKYEGEGGLRRYKFVIPFSRLDKMWVKTSQNGKYQFFVPTKSTPKLFKKRDTDTINTHVHGGTEWSEEINGWFRVTEIGTDRESMTQEPLSLKGHPAMIDVGRWTTYRITMDQSEAHTTNWVEIKRAMSNFNIQFVDCDELRVIPPMESCFWKLISQSQIRSGEDESRSLGLPSDTDRTYALPFPVRYQLEVCISQGFINEYNITPSFVKRLEELARENETRAVKTLEFVADKGERFFEPEDIFELSIPRSLWTRRIPPACVWQRSITITPTGIILNSPSVDVSNRIIRENSRDTDKFLRVRFTDEKIEGRLHGGDDDAMDPIFTRIYRCLRSGVTIGDRHYQYLAAGNSQFREHGAYFFASTLHKTAKQIQRRMGDFRGIDVPAKYAARVGQCFSTTYALTSTTVKFVEIADVERNGRKFTDGVGKISPFLARVIADERRLPNAPDDPPSVVQFRLGGSKGVLAVWPEAKKREVHIRPSQDKFPTQHDTQLEIVRLASFTRAQLNRQLINILTCLGVPDNVFIYKQDQQLNELERAVSDENLALELLQKRIDPNQSTLELAGIIRAGFMKHQEPFTMSMINLWRAWSVKYVKEKAQIDIDKGAFVLGCTDETQTLKGHTELTDSESSEYSHDIDHLPEIFLQISDVENPGRYRIIKDRVCILARNPSLHPGDIRIVRAVDNPRLHHLKNVIVFPQTGYRDLPSMCSGGDLDGDDFFISWDPQLIPEEWNHPPLQYDPPHPNTVDREVDLKDIHQFFVQFMKNDSIGRIATAHLANSDLEEGGARNPKCVELAQLHSTAVDFMKTGVPARMRKSLRPKKYPHFIVSKNRPESKIQHSFTALGRLHDRVEYERFSPSLHYPFDSRILNAFDDLSDAMLEKAQTIKNDYDESMRRIMAQHDIGTEVEVWTTFVLDHSKLVGDYKFHEEMGRLSGSLKDRFVDICCQEGCGGAKDFDSVARFVAAMYTVTATNVQNAMYRLKENFGVEVADPLLKVEPKDLPLMSFPWLFHRELGKIANGQRPRQKAASAEFVENDAGEQEEDGRRQLGFTTEQPQQNGYHHAVNGNGRVTPNGDDAEEDLIDLGDTPKKSTPKTSALRRDDLTDLDLSRKPTPRKVHGDENQPPVTNGVAKRNKNSSHGFEEQLATSGDEEDDNTKPLGPGTALSRLDMFAGDDDSSDDESSAGDSGYGEQTEEDEIVETDEHGLQNGDARGTGDIETDVERLRLDG
ncbi:MAG: hypothetical protein M1831_002862 [Alyxoria varia]|nr:MAG: hypothetical protein M1831_002862 [Alyxoria varia]